jgi:acyl-ACP thioesterase
MAERAARRATFPVHSYEVDAYGTLAVPALSGYLQELAGLHADELGTGLEALRAKGLTWVLARQRIELPLAVALGDTLEIETWPSGAEKLAATREFVVRRGDGAEAGRATTQWLMLDLATRRPVRLGDVLDPRFRREPLPPVAPLAEGKLPLPAAWDLERRFHVRYADIDVNLHVTNASYVSWAIEAAPVELWRASRVAAVEAHYLAEGHHGGAVLSRLARSGDSCVHSIVREEDGKELARLATAWTARAGRP